MNPIPTPVTPANDLHPTKLAAIRGYLEQAVSEIGDAAPQVPAKTTWKRFFIARLREASTYRGLMLILTAIGVAVRPEMFEAIAAVGMALAGLLGVIFPDTQN